MSEEIPPFVIVEINRYAKPHGLDEEVLSAYRRYVSEGEAPEAAIEMALYDWDL